MVVPLYLNFYSNQNPARGFLTAGADLIYVNHPGYYKNVFSNNGTAVTAGGGFEARSNGGFLFRAGVYLVAGRTALVEPGLGLG